MTFEIFHGAPVDLRKQIREWLKANPDIVIHRALQSQYGASEICISVFYDNNEWFISEKARNRILDTLPISESKLQYSDFAELVSE